MSSIQLFKQKFYTRYLNKELNRVRTLRLSTNLEDANTVGIIFNASDEKQKKVVLKYAANLKTSSKKVELLGFFDTKEEIEDPGFTFFNRKNIDWFNRPKGEAVKQFMAQPFDLLINLSGKTNPPFDFITALSKASFRVGPPTENTYSCDLMIDTKNPEDLTNFIKQAEFFLNKMATHNDSIPANR